MKKLLCILSLFFAFSVPVVAESELSMTDEEVYQAIHDMFANHTDEELENLLTIVNYEIEYRKQTKSSVAVTNSSDTVTQNLIVNFFEGKGLKIKRVLYQPLVEKDDGLYGGKERWWVTFENGDQLAAWVLDGTIEYFYNGIWYEDVPLY